MTEGVDIFSLVGKTALITGATGHLGRVTAFALAAAGATVLINSRSKKKSEELVSLIRADGLSAEPAVFDVGIEKEVNSFTSEFGKRPLHILINNAYVGGAGSIELSSSDQYIASYDVAVVAAHRLLQGLLPNLRSAVADCQDASVINLASMYALVSPDQRIYSSAEGVNPPFYGAAKAALLHWSRYAACEFGQERIRVNSVSPGPFPNASVQKKNPAFVEKISHKVPLGRVGQPEEICGAVLFLASHAASYVNGSNLVVDGGWTCW